jgi:amino acid adenylation domain-containing protein
VQVVETFNATDAEFPSYLCIHQLFEAQVERTPDAVAVAFEDTHLTYAELDGRANQLAHYLRERGVGPDARVAICVERGLEMMVALLAVLKAGGAYVPLDSSYPEDRLRYMLEDSAPVVLLTQGSLAGLFADANVPVVDLFAAEWSDRPETKLEGAVTPENLAYVIYTSGSTGMPKGVMVEHRSLVNHTAWQVAAFGIGAGDTVLQRTAISFDASVWELWTPLASGARIVLLPAAAAKDPAAMGEAIGRGGVTVVQFVPTLLQAVLQAMPEGARLPCRYVFCGGEPLPAALVAEALARGAGEVVNLYGPTEATIDSTALACGGLGEGRAPSIGRPVSNARVYILDAAGEPVPVGVAGELFIGGAGVARGYLNRPELTAERFVRDPFNGGRMYRTGDLGRWRADGTIEFLGRNDHQVKIRGFRIELGEIEARLAAHPAVREAVVAARGDAGDRRLVAYYVGEGEPESLRAHLLEALPEHMVPAAYVRLERLPLTPNGKLDRRALPAPAGDAFVTRGYEAPIGETETALAELWAELLRVERVGRNDHFFELGGHSLLAVTLIERMRRLGMHAEVRTLFATPTLAELAASVGGESHEVEVPANLIPAGCGAITPEMLPLIGLTQAEIDAVVAGVEGGAENVQDIYPLAPLQEGILFHHMLAAEGDPYLVSNLLGFESRELLDEFTGALQAVVARHDILRTAVVWEGLPEPVQVVWRRAPFAVEEVEIGEGDAAALLLERFDSRHHRLDVRLAPLLRGYAAFDEAGGRWLMLVLLHHLAGDHTTMDVLKAEVQAHLAGRADQLPAPQPFRNLVAQARLGVSKAEHEEFFTGMLGDVDEPTAPFGMLDVQGDGSGIAEARLELDSALAVRLRERARRLGVSVASLCHVAYGQVLARVSGKRDVVFGTVLFGRMAGGAGADRAMGLFINTLPIRLRMGGEGVEASVRGTQKLLAELLRHEHAPLSLAQRCSGVQRPTPLFSALFNYRHSGGGKAAAAEAPRGGIQGLHMEERTNYPLSLSVDDMGVGLRVTAQVVASVGAARVCAMMGMALEGLVHALESAPESAVGAIAVLPAAEREQVVEKWNRTDADFPADACVHSLFRAQAGRTPDAVAVMHDDRSLTYAELNAAANRLAHRLVERGVEAGDRVTVLVPRSIELVIAELAVLKAGGVYVPIDPSAPAERIAFMVADSASRIVLGLSGAALPELAGVERMDVDAPGEGRSDDLHVERASTDAAYVMYTSGSTGEPKGVVIGHQGITRLVINNGYAAFGSDDRVAFAANPAFDATTMEVWAPLVNGGCIVVVGQHVMLDPPAFATLLKEKRVTALFITTAVFNQYAASIPQALAGLRYLMTGGEAADPSSFARVLNEGGLDTVIHCYGPTETTTFAITHPVTHVAEGARSVPLGGPIGNTRIYILDETGEPVPVGVAGELYIGGPGVALGYLNRPELTAEKFVADRFTGEGRLYRTGDLGRWLADGTIEFMGRNDHQVKIRGFRIELGEIEARLAEHPEVRETMVLAREDVPGDKRLVAYYVAETAMDAEALRAHLSAGLPDYMVPAAYVWMERLPLTPNGKVDRKALPAPEADAFATRGYEAPVGEVEEALAEIWSELLGVERVGRHDNFFELGGHSLLAVTLIERMRRRELHADVRTLFSTPTLAELASAAGGVSHEVVVPANLIPEPAESEQAEDSDNKVEFFL